MVVFVLKWRRNWERSSPSFSVCRYWSPCRQRRRRRRHYWPTFGPGRREGGKKDRGANTTASPKTPPWGNWELGGAADLVKLSIFEQKASKCSSSPSKEIAADLFTSRSHCQLFLSLSRTFPSWGFLNPIRSNLHSDIGIGYVVAFVIHRCLSSIQIITERCQCFIMRSCVINAGRLFVIQYISWCSNIAVTQRAVLYAVGLALRRPWSPLWMHYGT